MSESFTTKNLIFTLVLEIKRFLAGQTQTNQAILLFIANETDTPSPVTKQNRNYNYNIKFIVVFN